MDDNDVDSLSVLMQDCPDPVDVWKRGLGSVSTFDKVAILTIDTTSRQVNHLHGILPFIPNLRDLTLICHWFDYEDETDMYLVPKTFAPDALVHLERLTLIGQFRVIAESALRILPATPKVKDFSMHCDRMEGHGILNLLEKFVERLAKQALESLTITGAEIYTILTAMETHQRRHGVKDCFDSIKRLTLDGFDEETHLRNLCLTQVSFDHPLCFHSETPSTWLNTQHSGPLPHLPVLESIALVQREIAGMPLEIRVGELRYIDEPKVISDIFDKYPQLLQIQFIDDIPLHPFTHHPADTWSDRQIRGWICRTYGPGPSPIKVVKIHTFAEAEDDELEWYDIGVCNGESLSTEDVRALYDMNPGLRDWVTSGREMDMPSEWEQFVGERRGLQAGRAGVAV